MTARRLPAEAAGATVSLMQVISNLGDNVLGQLSVMARWLARDGKRRGLDWRRAIVTIHAVVFYNITRTDDIHG